MKKQKICTIESISWSNNCFTQLQNDLITGFYFQYFSGTKIQPIPLSDGSDPEIGDIVKAVGWGKDSDDADWIRWRKFN